jgi:hypothetical protein
MTPAPVARPMRPLVLLAVAALAAFLSGCTVPEEDPEADPLFGLCPQWAQGPGSQPLGLQLAGNGSQASPLGPANATHDGKPLDLYRLHVDEMSVQGRTELRALAADGTRLNIRDYRLAPSQQLVPVVAFTDGSAAGQDFDVFLSSVAHGSTPAPAPVTLQWTQVGGNTSAAATVSYHYKVCGAEL